jgi:hypothetical protein
MDFNLHIPANALLFTICLSLSTIYGAGDTQVEMEPARTEQFDS